MDEIRNELIYIRNIKAKIDGKNNEDIELYFDLLLDRFKIDLDRKKEDLENELKRVNETIKLFEIIKKEVLKNEK